MSPRDKDRRKISGRVIGAAAAGAGVLLISIGALISNIGSGSDTPSPGAGVVRLELIAARDIGALPAVSSWCATARPAEHCWIYQHGSGDATDYGSPGGWHMVPIGSPRPGLVASLPVRDASGWVDITGELATWLDGPPNRYQRTSTTQDSTQVLSVTTLINARADVGYLWRHFSTTGLIMQLVAGAIRYSATGSITTKTMDAPISAESWNCVTAVLDSRSATAGQAYVNGVQVATDVDYEAGDWSASSTTVYLGTNASTYMQGGVARHRLDYAALTLADHQALCGDLWQAPAGGGSDNKPLASDDTWTQTAGAGCYPTGDSTAVCVPGGLMPYHVVDSARGPAWPPQQAITNPVLYSTAMDCTNWTCVGATSATYGKVAPDGSATATEITVALGANHFEQDISAGYTASASPLHLGMWLDCSSGLIHPHGSNDGARGDWDVSCSCIGGQWTYIHADHPCVTVQIPFNADGSGDSGIHYDGTVVVDATVWAPTLTEQRAWSRVVIPTAAAGISLGNPIWAINNTSTNYYRVGDTVTQSLTTYDGTCFAVPGTDILLAGSPTCSGSWYGLKVQK